jgi:hypothetical protein
MRARRAHASMYSVLAVAAIGLPMEAKAGAVTLADPYYSAAVY